MKNWSIPNCQPNRYSLKVAAPMAPAAHARTMAAFSAIDDRRCKYNASPAIRNASAVLTFISTAPGTRLRNAGSENIQPDNVASDDRQMRATAPRAKYRRLGGRDAVLGDERII